MSLDHGVLNVPLSKRVNIDAQIDRHMAAQRREREVIARETRKAFAEAKAEALALVERLTQAHETRLAAKFRCQVRSVRKRLRSHAGVNPTLVLRALRDGGAT